MTHDSNRRYSQSIQNSLSLQADSSSSSSSSSSFCSNSLSSSSFRLLIACLPTASTVLSKERMESPPLQKSGHAFVWEKAWLKL